MNEQILLNKNKSKVSTNVNNSLTVNLSGSKRLLPCDPMETTISEIDVYNKERENCSKIRLTLQINPICSNVLFNNLTEIVRNEGTDYVKCLNFIDLSNVNDDVDNNFKWNESNLKFKTINDFDTDGSVISGIRDTQLNNKVNNFKYHCGLDIFNNHYLRSKTFKTVCPGNYKYFNTIFDKMRGYNGNPIDGYIDNKDDFKNGEDLHLYLNEEISSYKATVSSKLIEKNGWFGFTNIGKMKVYNDTNKSIYNTDYDWFQVINDRKPCDFIDMYPNRELFFFDPKYNSYKHRIEKNWLYCITYPSSSTTDIPFIKVYENNTSGLKVTCFDDTIKYKNGTDAIKIWSVSKHGLSKDNIINLYKGEECILRNAKVIGVDNDYVFYVFRNGVKVSEKWANIKDKISDDITVDGITYHISNDKSYIYLNEKRYKLINNQKANIDDNAQDISFKRVVRDSETSYYVRIFSKLPNWKFKKQNLTEELLGKKPNIIKEYQTSNNDFENHIGKLAFSKNIYTDNIAEVVFTDDIDISVLKDNLGRPLSELYFTIIKNNAGYREWYGKYNKPIDLKNNIIEYSHCFGKLSCAFKLTEESYYNKDYNNVLLINNVDNTIDRNGLDMTILNEGNRNDIDDDEIQYEPYNNYSGDSSFYGDLCCYSDDMCEEQSIQMVDFRFNTAQRELTNSNYTAYNFMSSISYDEIISDDYDDNGFKERTYTITDAVTRREGYYYKPHYKISIKSYDNELTTIYPRFLTIRELNNNGVGVYSIITMENHFLGENSLMNIYDKINKKFYFGKVTNVINTKSVEFKVYSDVKLEEEININVSNKKDFKFFIKGEDIPEYATLLKDGSCRYVYRELYQNGFYSDTDVETYPFTNGNFYINKNITLFLKRQNPNGTNDLRSRVYPYDITNNTISFEKENNYYHELEIEC